MTELGKWMQARHLTCGENSAFGNVYPVHAGTGTTWSSYHYRHGTYPLLGPRDAGGTPQGNLAIDVNAATFERWRLRRLYKILLARRYELGIAELFYEDKGYPAPVPDHYTHLHVAVRKWAF